jgi:hypothetical protein
MVSFPSCHAYTTPRLVDRLPTYASKKIETQDRLPPHYLQQHDPIKGCASVDLWRGSFLRWHIRPHNTKNGTL